ncbi:uncharacterized protein LOC119442447 isoform X1 [Dermacentor silvarum]|uniref:uncharacterized protein LOC119442447 isoform X1 n=1 Tax=Dermacentor silvarum TaxID=543639 RepID=UPI001898AB4C|nr:uncharacterized protein LOC119442447 isoform X1 [Dermacentor silvarum]
MQRKWISEGITKDADLDDCVGAASPAFERPAFQRQTSEVISTIDEPTENINLSWNAPEFYKRLKRFRRTQLEYDTWNPNRWASCPEVVNPSPQALSTPNPSVRFYVGTSPSGQSISDEDEEERYKTYLYYLLSTTRSASSEIRFLDLFQEAQDNIRALPRQESNSTLDVILSSRQQLSYSPSHSSGVGQRASWSSGGGDECFNRKRLVLYAQEETGSGEVLPFGHQHHAYSQPVSHEGSRVSVATISASVSEKVTRPRRLCNDARDTHNGAVWCRAYDNPCFDATGSPKSSFQNSAPATVCTSVSNGETRVVAQQPSPVPPSDTLFHPDRKCSVFDVRRLNAILRYMFCCDCCVWDAGQARRPTES